LDGLTNDEADAVGLAMFGQALHGAVTLPRTNMEPVDKVRLQLAGN